MDDKELRATLTGALDEAVRLARTGQQIIDLAGDLNRILRSLSDLQEREPELGPELLTAANALSECSEALGRVLTTNAALMDARRDRMFPTDEGGPS